MRSEELDIVIEGRHEATWITLAGAFHAEQIPNMREKFSVLLDDANRSFVVDLEQVTVMHPLVPQMFLTVFNDIRGKGGEVRFVFRNQVVTSAFAPYQNLFPIYPDAALVSSGGFLKRLFRRRLRSKKTGIRISRQLALFFLVVLFGWLLSLFFIIYLQNRRIAEQERELAELTEWKQRSAIELSSLRERIRPLEQLGILRDTTKQ